MQLLIKQDGMLPRQRLSFATFIFIGCRKSFAGTAVDASYDDFAHVPLLRTGTELLHIPLLDDVSSPVAFRGHRDP